jgi:proteasome lid subunit RPN8/RPN11
MPGSRHFSEIIPPKARPAVDASYMKNKVRVKKSQLDYFRRLARQSEFEIQAYLVGYVASPTLTIVDSFAYTKEYAVQTSSRVGWSYSEYNRVSQEAEKQGRRIIGSIHSHPHWDAVMSEDDYVMCVTDGSRLCGICSTGNEPGKRTRVRFWLLDSPLPCEIIYAKSKPR